MAAATVCAEYAGLALGLFLARRSLGTIAGDWRWAVIKRAAAFRRLVAVNRDIMLRSLSLEAVFLTFTALGSRQGEVILATNAILLHFQQFAAFGLDGFADAAEAMVGRQATSSAAGSAPGPTPPGGISSTTWPCWFSARGLTYVWSTDAIFAVPPAIPPVHFAGVGGRMAQPASTRRGCAGV